MIYKILISIILCLGIGFLGGFATASSVNEWYVMLNKPIFNPPSYLFGPVWTLLYILMGVSVGMIWHDGNSSAHRKAIGIFIIQLILNFLWSFLFFYFQQPFIAFIEIVVLWVMIILTIKHFYSIKKMAAYLLLPYLAWVSFASVLNFSLYWLNR